MTGCLLWILFPAVLRLMTRLTTVFAAVETFERLVSFVTYSTMNILFRLLDDINPPVVLPNLPSNAVGLLLLNIDGRLFQTLDVRFNSHRLDQQNFYFSESGSAGSRVKR